MHKLSLKLIAFLSNIWMQVLLAFTALQMTSSLHAHHADPFFEFDDYIEIL